MKKLKAFFSNIHQMFQDIRTAFNRQNMFKVKAEYNHPVDSSYDHRFTVAVQAANQSDAVKVFFIQERQQRNDVRNIKILCVEELPQTALNH